MQAAAEELVVDSARGRLLVWAEGEGPVVLLLHGFPDTARLWRNQVPDLVRLGWRVLAPDLRGFGGSDKPVDRGAYAVRAVADDLIEVLDATGTGEVVVVGHDWGALTGWSLAGRYRDRVRGLVAISVGHPRAFVRSLWDQAHRSWYAAAFRVPRIPEALLRHNDWQLFRWMLGSSPDLEEYIARLGEPGALNAALQWYRANAKLRDLISTSIYGDVDCPVLGIAGRRDHALGIAQMRASERFCRGPWSLEIVDSGHWVPLERPEVTSTMLTEFLASL